MYILTTSLLSRANIQYIIGARIASYKLTTAISSSRGAITEPNFGTIRSLATTQLGKSTEQRGYVHFARVRVQVCAINSLFSCDRGGPAKLSKAKNLFHRRTRGASQSSGYSQVGRYCREANYLHMQSLRVFYTASKNQFRHYLYTEVCQ